MPNLVDQPRTILLLEDNPDDERLALRALNSCGIAVTVRVARDGKLGLAALGLEGSSNGQSKEVPDLVISDLKMPMFNGDEVLARTKEDDRLRNVPYVIFSSSEEPADLQRCQELGADAYYVKPVRFEDYMECARDIVRQWLGPNGDSIRPECEADLPAGTP